MTDFELNKAIAEALGFKFIEPFTGGDEGAITVKVPHTHVEKYLDYCNNWNDLMPLIMEYLTEDKDKLIITSDMVYYEKYSPFDNISAPIKLFESQIALAECLLKVLQSK